MYIDNSGHGYYTPDGTQMHTRAPFLLLLQTGDDFDAIRGIVRKVALRQLGPWMMGKARIGGHTISVSGTYGSDGLPCTVPQDVFDRGVPLPQELFDAWNEGGGWNSAGNEASAMREWAQTIQK